MGFVTLLGRYIELKGDYSDGTSLSSVYQLEIYLGQVLKFDLKNYLAS